MTTVVNPVTVLVYVSSYNKHFSACVSVMMQGHAKMLVILLAALEASVKGHQMILLAASVIETVMSLTTAVKTSMKLVHKVDYYLICA